MEQHRNELQQGNGKSRNTCLSRQVRVKRTGDGPACLYRGLMAGAAGPPLRETRDTSETRKDMHSKSKAGNASMNSTPNAGREKLQLIPRNFR